MLDDDLKPWLIEVNLSPACSERTHFLRQMLQYMTDGLFRILRDKEKLQAEEFSKKLDDLQKLEAQKQAQRKLNEEKEQQYIANYGTAPYQLTESINASNLANSPFKN